MTSVVANPKTMAAFFIDGLTRGYIEPAGVIQWVDGVIVASQKTEDWMLDLSTAHPDDGKAVLHLLYQIPGEIDQAALARLLFDAYKKRFEISADVYQAISDAFRLGHLEGFPKHMAGEAYQLEDEAERDFGRPTRRAELSVMVQSFFSKYEEA